jgi:hypothetical protein
VPAACCCPTAVMRDAWRPAAMCGCSTGEGPRAPEQRGGRCSAPRQASRRPAAPAAAGAQVLRSRPGGHQRHGHADHPDAAAPGRRRPRAAAG